jgi:tRNA G18 (ribose-2'-O)-methylase SpoU
VKTEKTIMVLDRARNFGAIIRTAECTGVNGIMFKKQALRPLMVIP